MSPISASFLASVVPESIHLLSLTFQNCADSKACIDYLMNFAGTVLATTTFGKPTSESPKAALELIVLIDAIHKLVYGHENL
jgi:hypothetical protein